MVLWNRDRSVLLSILCTRFVIVCAAGLAAGLLVYLLVGNQLFLGRDTLVLMLSYDLFCVPALIALFSLDRLLAAVQREEVFTASNVKYLRIISWCCFAAGVVIFAGTFYIHFAFFVLAILAIFFGVILRVVKNLFAAAVELKTENDYTV